MVKLSENMKLRIRIIVLTVLDLIAMEFASFMALWLRFEFRIADIPESFIQSVLYYTPVNMVVVFVAFYIFGLYRSLWRYAGTIELLRIAEALGCIGIIQFVGMNALNFPIPKSYYLLFLMIFGMLVTGIRFSYRFFRGVKSSLRGRINQDKRRIMIIGAGEAGAIIAKEIETSAYLSGHILCFIDDDIRKHGRSLHGVLIEGGRNLIPECVQKYQINQIIIAIPSASKTQIKEILDICNETGCKLKILPGMYQLINGEVGVSRLRNVQIEDLLGREPVETNLEEILGYVKGKTVLVTGGGGSIGSELCRQIADYQPKLLVIFDIYENNAYEVQQDLLWRHPELNLKVLIGSVRNTKRMDWIFQTYHPDLVYHAAAHKHVPLMEESPNEAIKNNSIGTYKTALMAAEYGVKKFVQISTDKAVNPTNIMGASKRLCEMIIQCMNRQYPNTDFVAVRFGNVLGSNGSVIPLFKRQIEEGGPVTVTDPKISRYFMTIPEAVALVLQAGAYATGGEIFVLDMGEPVKILDLAEKLIKLSGYTPGEDIKIKFIGLRPGEKMTEEMLMTEEGLQETANRRIHIGKPIAMDDQWFLEKLDILDEASYQENADICMLVKELVPEYVLPRERISKKVKKIIEIEVLREAAAAAESKVNRN